MKYRFSCPNCGHGQESSFVRIGAQVECPRCEEVFRIEPEILEGGGASGLGPATGNKGPGGGGDAGADPDAEHLLGGEEPEALVGLSGLSGLMHEASDPGEKKPGGDAEAGGVEGEGSGVGGAFPGNTGAAGSFRGAAESGFGVEPFADEEDEPPAPPAPPATPARAAGAGGGAAGRGKPAAAPISAPPTRDQLRRERARERAEAAERKRRRRRITLFSTLAAGIAIGFLVGLFALLSDLGAAGPDEAPAAAPGAAVRAPAADAPQERPDAEPRMIYARRVEGADAVVTPDPLPNLGVTAVALDDPLQQTRRLRVVLVAGDEPVPPSIRLHLRADAPGEPAWIAGVAGGVPAGGTRELTVALNPPLASDGWTWTPTPTR